MNRKISWVLLLSIFVSQLLHSTPNYVDPADYGAVGDGVEDDSVSLQRALTACSELGVTCLLPSGKKYLVTTPLFLWGEASLRGEDSASTILLNAGEEPYILNLGISGKNKLEAPFSGVISHVNFEVIGGQGGRIIYLWRTRGASILNNTFDVSVYPYSATSSGNNNSWVKNGFQNCIRENIVITGNKIVGSANNLGSEGIGLGHFDGAVIERNEIIGVGDDPVGIHFSKNITISNNIMKSVDGRIFVSDSQNVNVSDNQHERVRSAANNSFYRGISLLYIGFESLTSNEYAAPSNAFVRSNILQYPAGAIDGGAAIYIYGPRNVSIDNNTILNNSGEVTATAIHLLPAVFEGFWADPENSI